MLEIAVQLESAGFEAWAVGGAIRDAILGSRPRADWDLATDARPDEVSRLFRRTVPLGLEHGTVGVLAEDDAMYEVTTFRQDVETDGRHAVVEFATNLEDDLARRDFTINAIAWRPATDDLCDPYEGIGDLRDGVLRAVGEPSLRFAEDYLRVLRGFRFAGAYDLSVEPATESALRESAGQTSASLSAERVREELLKVLSARTCRRDRSRCTLTTERSTGGILEIALPRATGHSFGRSAWQRSILSAPHRSFLRVVRLSTSVRADTRRTAAEGVEALLRRLKFSNAGYPAWNAPRRRTTSRSFTRPTELPPFVNGCTRWERRPRSRPVPTPLRGCPGHRARPTARRALAYTWRSECTTRSWNGAAVSIAQLAVGGRDLLALGLPSGPLVGLMLEELLAQVIESPDRNEREAYSSRAPGNSSNSAGLDSLESVSWRNDEGAGSVRSRCRAVPRAIHSRWQLGRAPLAARMRPRSIDDFLGQPDSGGRGGRPATS